MWHDFLTGLAVIFTLFVIIGFMYRKEIMEILKHDD